MNDPMPCECGNDDVSVAKYDGAVCEWYQVWCSCCGDQSLCFRTRDEAVTAWNKGDGE